MIKEVLSKLTPEQRALLMYAFEHFNPGYIVLENGYFIGVHCLGIPHLVITETQGTWSYGTIKSST